MTFLPVVARELRVAARRRSTYWSRFFTAVIAMLLGLIIYYNSRDMASHKMGTALFDLLSLAAFIYCLATGIRSTADCLSEEKRDGTLGLLFLTDLKGYDVVGGKLVATSLNAFYGLLAIFPLLAIPLLMGGVTNGEFWRMALVLANTFFLSLAMGMFMSAISTSPRKAMAGTLVVMLCLSAVFPILAEVIPYLMRSRNVQLVLACINPDTAFSLVHDPDYRTDKAPFWWCIGVLHASCWLLLAIASYIVPRSWQDHPAGEQKQRWRERWHRWSFGDPGERASFRNRLLDINAFYWLAGRARLKPAHVWVVFFLLGCLWMWGAIDQGKGWLNSGIYLLTAFVLNSTLKIWVASEAGRRFGEERKMGSLELILSTPLSVREIVRGQVLALQRQFLGPLVVTLVVEAVFLMASLQEQEIRTESESMLLASLFGLGTMAMLVTDLMALAALAMWTSLTAKNPNRTTGMTTRRILVLPWVVTVLVAMISTIGSFGARGGGPGPKFLLGLYFCTGFAADLVFGLNAWNRLHAEFREVAAQRFSAAPSWLRSLFQREQKYPQPPPVTVP